MPKTAIAGDDVDGVLYIDQLAEALTALAAGEAFATPPKSERAVS
jgi:hypothetical protein